MTARVSTTTAAAGFASPASMLRIWFSANLALLPPHNSRDIAPGKTAMRRSDREIESDGCSHVAPATETTGLPTAASGHHCTEVDGAVLELGSVAAAGCSFPSM